jgi:vibriolysin
MFRRLQRGARVRQGIALLGAALAGCHGEADPAITTRPVRHLELALAPVGADLARAAPAYLADLDDQLGLDLPAEAEYQVRSIAAGADGLRHVRMQQLHAGVPVRGAELVVHADDTTFLGFNGILTRGLDGFPVVPAVAQEAALEAARSERTGGTTARFRREAVELVIQPGEEGGATLVWRVELLNDGQAELAPGRWIYLVDAASGAVVRRHDALTTEQASGPGGNPKRSRQWTAELDVEPMGGEFVMQTSRLVTYDLKGGTETPADPVRGPLDPIADAAADDAHGYAEVTLDMMRDWYGHDSIDDQGFVIVSRVHYNAGWDNASWNGSEMSYGDGSEWFHPLGGALDVVAHEINHGFTQFHSDLDYSGMSGALNESFSDIAGTLAEFYFEGDDADFLLGEDVFKQRADGALRYLCNPPLDREDRHERHPDEPATGSIEHANDFARDMNVHLSSGVPNKAFCLAVGRFRATSTGGSAVEAARRVGSAWYLANASYWTTATGYVEGCQGVVDAARALGFSSEEVAALADSWADVGVECEGQTTACDEDDRCELQVGETCASCPGDCGACSEDCGWFKKLKCKIGIGDCSRCDAPAGCGDSVCAEDEDDESCAEDCGCAAPGDTCGSVAPYGCWCDADCEASDDCCDDVGEVCE